MKSLWVVSIFTLSLSVFGQTSSSIGSGTTVPLGSGNVGSPSSSTNTNTTTNSTQNPSDMQRMEDVSRSTPATNSVGGSLGGGQVPAPGSGSPASGSIPRSGPTGSGTGMGSGASGMGTGVGAPGAGAAPAP